MSEFLKYEGINFFIPLLSASAICSTGFVTNSETTVIGSMLISPIGYWILKSTNKKDGDITNIVLSGGFFLMLCVTIFSGIISSFFTISKDTTVVEGRSTVFRKNNYNFIASVVVVFFASLLFAWADSNNTVISTGIGIATALLPPLVATGFIIGKNLKEKNETILQLNDSLYSLSLFVINLLSLVIGSMVYYKYK